jgi:hypothetical protein
MVFGEKVIRNILGDKKSKNNNSIVKNATGYREIESKMVNSIKKRNGTIIKIMHNKDKFGDLISIIQFKGGNIDEIYKDFEGNESFDIY